MTMGIVRIVADENIPFVREAFSSLGNVKTVAGRKMTSAIVAEANILLVRSVTRVDKNLLDGSNVKMVATATIGTDHIDMEYLNRRGIAFASAAGCNANSVAEYIIAALLAIANRYKISLTGKTIGVVGVGNVGSKVSAKADVLGMKVLKNDPPLEERSGSDEYIELEELLEQADFVTLHTPLTMTEKWPTFHLADENFFARLKKDAFLLNSSRGAVVDNNVLKENLKRKKLAGAVLDVWENEPDIDVELLNVVDIGTPHIAGYSFDGKVAGTQMIYNAVCKFLGIEPQWNHKLIMPAPAVPMIHIDKTSGNIEADISDVIKQVYDITEDDRRLREIKSYLPNERGKFFDQLRKNYPIRREFFNTKLVFAESVNPTVRSILSGLGFQSSET